MYKFLVMILFIRCRKQKKLTTNYTPTKVNFLKLSNCNITDNKIRSKITKTYKIHSSTSLDTFKADA